MKTTKYQKKPLVIEAEQFWPDKKPWPVGVVKLTQPNRPFYTVETIHGPVEIEPGCMLPEYYYAKRVNSKGRNPLLMAIPEDGLGPPLIWSTVERVWNNFYNEHALGRFLFKTYDEERNSEAVNGTTQI